MRKVVVHIEFGYFKRVPVVCLPFVVHRHAPAGPAPRHAVFIIIRHFVDNTLGERWCACVGRDFPEKMSVSNLQIKFVDRVFLR